MQIDAGWARWGDTNGGRVQEPYISILIEAAEQAQFNAASVVACGIARCKCILQSIAVAFHGAVYSTMLDMGAFFCESPRPVLFFVPCYLGDVSRGFCSCEEFLTRVLGVQPVVL